MGRATAIGFMKDTAAILQHGRSVVILALNDMSNLFTASQKQADPSKAVGRCITCQEQSQWAPSTMSPNLLQKESKACLRKLQFLLAWANELPIGTYESLTEAVLSEWQQHAGTLTDHTASDISIDPYVQATLTNDTISSMVNLHQQMGSCQLK